MSYDILIRGGEVVDPSQSLHQFRDVAVSNGKIAAVEKDIDCSLARTVIDARGQLVTPGLIDLHVHVYPHSPLGLDPDSLCAAGGVTTMLDTGTAGSYNFDAFRRDVIERARTQVFGLVNLSCVGLACGNLGELLDRRYADPDGVVATIERNRDVAVGVKIRATANIIGDGEQGWANLNDAIKAARDSNTWLMVHIGDSPMPIPELAEALSPGDCITHCFRASSRPILNDKGKIFEAVRAAADRGVIFDVGHGFGSFDWHVAQAALDDGFEPTTISTDLHTMNINGPVYDMPTTMSKFLTLGLSLERVVEMSTARPAQILNKANDLGTLKVGTIADIAVLERLTGDFVLSDCNQQTRPASEVLIAATTVRRGEIVPGGGGRRMVRRAEG
jgi:dihydroorotase